MLGTHEDPGLRPFVARKRLQLQGVTYEAHEPVPLDGVSAGLRRRLLEQQRVVPRAADEAAAARPATPSRWLHRVPRDIDKRGRLGDTRPASNRHPLAVKGTCGWHGGRKSDGNPCGTLARGVCQHHQN